MGKIDVVVNRYCSDKVRFADLFNGMFFGGRQIVKPEELTESVSVYRQTSASVMQEADVGQELKEEEYLGRTRDIKMENQIGITFRILATESQEEIDYSMPFRTMQYDVLEYQEQVTKIRRKNGLVHKGKRKTLGKLRKSDRLWPVYTICIYYGTKKWDGPRSLRDMMDFGADEDGMSEFFADYPFRLFCVNEMEDFSVFQTELQDVFNLMRYRKNKKKMLQLIEENPKYQSLDEETLELLTIVVDEPRIWEQRNRYKQEGKQDGKEGYNMCKAWKEMKKDARREGKREGKREGILEAKIEDIKCMMRNLHLTMEQAMEALEIPVGEQERYRRTLEG